MGSIDVELFAEINLENIETGKVSKFLGAPAATEQVKLEEEEGYIWTAPEIEEDSILQSNGLTQSATYTNEYPIFEKNIFKQTFGMKAIYANLGDTSNLKTYIHVNGKNILKLVDISYKHCPGSSKEKDSNNQHRIPLFKVGFPILFIITVNVDAAISINYGFRWFYGSNANVNGCNMTFQPYFKPGFEASGYVSALVAKAGVYASGTVANSYLNFIVNSWGLIPFSNGNINLNVQIVPFEFEVGAFYQLYKCNLKKLLKFKFKKVCSWGDRKTITIAKTKDSTGKTLSIFSHKWGKQ
jgi:hypothetical protein